MATLINGLCNSIYSVPSHRVKDLGKVSVVVFAIVVVWTELFELFFVFTLLSSSLLYFGELFYHVL